MRASVALARVVTGSRRRWSATLAVVSALLLAGAVAQGQTAVGSSTTQTVTVNFPNFMPVMLNADLATAIRVTTQGLPNLDYTYLAGGTCAPGGSYTYTTPCTVMVKFAPTFPGQRAGAVSLYASSGALVAQANINGRGTGPLGVLEGVVPTAIATVAGAVGLSTDSAGNNIYLSASGRVYRYGLNPDGTYTRTTLQAGLNTPGGTAVDNAGNLYYAVANDGTGMGGVFELTPDQQVANGVAVEVAQGSFTPDKALAVDTAGNLYFADVNTFQIYKIAPGLPVMRGASVYSAGVGERLSGLVVDPNGVIYAGGVNSGRLYKIAAGGAGFVVALDMNFSPNGFALDAAGDVYLSSGTTSVLQYLPDLTSAIFISNVRALNGLAIDAAGSLYGLATNGALSVVRRTSGPLSLPNATVGYPSAPSSILLANIGNAPLTPSALSATSPFSVDASGTCVVGTAVAPTASCTIASTFTPPAAQAYTGTVTLTDDSPASVATKTVNMSGTGQVGTLGSFTVTLPGTVLAGTPFTATFQATDQNSNKLTTYNATASLTSSDPQAVLPATVTFTNGTASASVTFKTAGSKSLIVKDQATNISVAKSTVVTPAAPVSLTAPATATVGAGTTFNLALSGADAYGNVIANVPVNITVPATGSSATPLANPAIATGNATFSQNAILGSYTIGFNAGTLTASTAVTVSQPDTFVVTVLTDPATGTAALCVNQNTASAYQTGGTSNTACSLRDAVAAANATSGSVISFASGLATTAAPGSISLTGVLTLTKAVTLTGPGSTALTLNGSGSGMNGILRVTSSNTPISVSGLTFLNATGPSITTGTTDDAVLNDIVVKGTNGTVTYAVNLQGVNTSILNSSFVSNATTSAAVFVRYGSAFTNLVFDSNTTTAPTSAAALVFYGLGVPTVRNATFVNNTGVSAAALTKDNNGGGATITIANSTFSGNTATGTAGSTIGRGNFVLRNVTLYGNTHAAGSVGPVAASGNVSVQNSILAGENGVTSAGTCSGCALAGNNLIGVDPLLLPLGNYGSAQPQSPMLQTHLPMMGSPAICTGSATSDSTDERGFARPTGTCYDIGAVQTAYALAVTQQPTTTLKNAAITPAPAVQVTEHALTFSGSPVNVTVSAGTLAGTASKSTDGTGTASFNDLSVDTTGSKTLTFTSGMLSVVSNAFTVVPPAPTVLLAVNPTSQTYGTAVAPNTFTGSAMFNGNSIPGTYTYTATTSTGNAINVAQGTTVLPASAYKVVANFTPTDPANYAPASSSTSVTNYTVDQAATPITFTVANHTYGDASFTVAATSASTGAFTYTVVSGPATISGSSVTLTGAGAVVLQAAQAATANYTANTQTGNFTVAMASPSVTNVSSPSIVYGTANTTLSATVNFSGTTAPQGAFTFKVGTSSAVTAACTVAAQVENCTVSYPTASLAVNTYTITGTLASGPNYNTASGTGTLTVTPATAAITFTVANHTYGDAPFTVSASSASTGAITYAVVSGPATISGSTVTLTGAGTVVLQASQAADANYQAGTKQASFIVSKTSSTTVSTTPITTAMFGATTTSTVSIPTVGNTAATGAVTYAFDGGTAMSSQVTNGSATITVPGTLAGGSHTVAVTYPGDGNYSGGTAQQTFTVAQSATAPTLTFAPIATHTYGDAAFTVSASSASTGAITYSVVSGPATISGSTVTLTGAGTVTLQASQAADNNYKATSGMTTFAVNMAVPTLTFAAIPAHTYGDAPFMVSASSAGTGAITYSVVSGSATINGSTVTLTGAGTVTLQASQAADANYKAANGTTTFTVNMAAAPTVTFAAIPAHTYGDAPFTVSASSASSGAITYSVVSGPATINGSTVTLNGAGSVVLQASQAADNNYKATTGTTSFQVTLAGGPTVTFAAIGAHTFGDAPFTVSASSASTGAITYSVVSGPATISGSTVTLNGAGTVVLQASQAADNNYKASTGTTSFQVTLAGAPTVAFATIGAHTFGDAPFTVSASSASTGAITYSVVSGPATISGSTVTLNGAGTVVLQASQAADNNYKAGSGTTSFTVAMAGSPAITFSVANHIFGDAPFTIAASSASSGALTYSVVSGPASVSGSVLTLTGAGTVTLLATQAATANYAAGTRQATFAVGAAASATALVSSNNPSVSGANVTFTATVTSAAGTPAGSVVFSDGGTALATVATVNGVATYSTTALSVATHTITATFSSANNTSSTGTVTQVVNSSVAFTLTDGGASSFALSILRGGIGSTTITITPSAQFSGVVTLACTGLPAYSSCSFTSPSLTFAAGGTAQTTQVAISTSTYTARNDSKPLDRNSALEAQMAGVFFLPGLLLAGCAARNRKLGGHNRLMTIGFLLLGFAGIAGITGCGAHGSTATSAAGTYTVNVTATSGTTTQSLPITVTIQ